MAEKNLKLNKNLYKLKLKPSMREKKRYLLIKLNANSKDEAREQVDSAILNFIGVLGYAKAGVMFLDVKKDSLILAVNRNQVDKVRGAFALSKFEIKVVRVSGSLKGLKSER